MTVSPWMIYFIGIVDNIKFGIGFAFLVIALLLLFSCILGPMLLIEEPDNIAQAQLIKTSWKVLGAGFVLFGLISLFVPSGKTLAAMYVIPAVVNNEQLQNISGNTLRGLEILTKDWLETLMNNAKEEVKDQATKL